MELFIKKESKVEDICKFFTAYYPFLKIELYKKTAADFFKKEALPVGQTLSQLLNNNVNTAININDATTVADIENSFSLIGLKAEVFRKSGNVWVETSLTNNWTLQQQNCEGEEISRHFP